MNKTVIILSIILFSAVSAFAHYDGVDGPVVIDAKKAIELRDVNYVLGWVKPEYESEIIEAYDKTLKVRTANDAARELADNYFFETVVRLHRLGEGAPYSGLKPAGRDLGPAITGADESLASGSLTEVYETLNESMHHKLHSLFDHVIEKKKNSSSSVSAFREFVEAYVHYIHYVEEIYNLSAGDHAGHL